jgi:hypothetical protein
MLIDGDLATDATRAQTAATLAAGIIAASGRPWSIEQALDLRRDIYFAMHPRPNSDVYQEWAKTKNERLCALHGPLDQSTGSVSAS